MKRALGKTSRDSPAERGPERDEEDLERWTEEEEEEEERVRDLMEKRKSERFRSANSNRIIYV